ncbi:hypothetical protein P154DRAFT_305424 [Amniculicola lignicola CBS 123094]|uniref:Zn(2)-C6 fungal-type domain-containing protein n=1 Tax=Amniculicola lignicola CBS 123094 TaxID=1392246 RepID=A0A6A5W4T9_9PLEO|nr:hypothetical protein P154DRAFT_305424 [Amniculicola lignicola CBS 123094]
MVDSQSQEKLHAACDECRTRKLKCSGDAPRCSRCEREGINCVYSPQKPMGRPRKRRREDAQPQPDVSKESPGETSSSAEYPLLPHSHGGSVSLTEHNLVDVFPHMLSPPISDFPMDPPIDPSLWDAQPMTSKASGPSQPPSLPEQTQCTCLSIMYLTLSDLQSMTSFSFPEVIPVLRQAMSTAHNLIQCEKCPKNPFSAIQNVFSLTGIMTALAERYHKVLQTIDQEAAQMDQTGEKKSFRIGDNNPALAHLHDGTENCPMGFNIDLEATEWKRLAKNAVRTEVFGGGSNPAPLFALLQQFEDRQTTWHTSDINLEERERIFGKCIMQNRNKGEMQCVRNIQTVRFIISNMSFE